MSNITALFVYLLNLPLALVQAVGRWLLEKYWGHFWHNDN